MIKKLKYLLSQVNPSPSKGELQVHVKLSFNTLSRVHSALTSQGPETHGSGTTKKNVTIEKCIQEAKYASWHILSQVNPFPIKGGLHVQLKLLLSWMQIALTSQGLGSQGSGTASIVYTCSINHKVCRFAGIRNCQGILNCF